MNPLQLFANNLRKKQPIATELLIPLSSSMLQMQLKIACPTHRQIFTWDLFLENMPVQYCDSTHVGAHYLCVSVHTLAIKNVPTCKVIFACIMVGVNVT